MEARGWGGKLDLSRSNNLPRSVRTGEGCRHATDAWEAECLLCYAADQSEREDGQRQEARRGVFMMGWPPPQHVASMLMTASFRESLLVREQK